MFITRLEYSILLFLQQHPLANLSLISDNLGVSFYTVKKTYQSLLLKNLISGVAAIISPAALNLEKATVFFEVDNYQSIKKLEKILDSHNYTRYRSRYICGESRGLYVNFELPSQCAPFLQEFGDLLVEKGIINFYALFSRNFGEYRTSANVRFVDWETLEWRFDIKSWINSLHSSGLGDSTDIQTSVTKPTFNNSFRINELDLWVMRALSKDAKLTIKKLKEIIETESDYIQNRRIVKDPSTISRSVKRIEDKFILEYQLLLNNKLLGLDNQIIFQIHEDGTLFKKLVSHLVKYPLPFKSTLSQFSGGFHWYIRCPSEYMSELVNAIWELNPLSMKVIHLIPPSRLYYFYPLNYDIVNKKWKDDYSWFFDPVRSYL
ncbi:MAG: hypothetical protein ACTSYD_12120 [Candidatus Heimdallarchaeaceae archaeon]